MKKIKEFVLINLGILTLFLLFIFLLKTPKESRAFDPSQAGGDLNPTYPDLSFTLMSDDTYSVKAADSGSISDSVTIPSYYNGKPVTSIGIQAFYNCSSLTSITIPDSVTRIKADAFRGCSGLTNISIPDGVTSIESRVFEGCRSLTSITIPDGVTTIGDSAFLGCKGLTSITIPDSVSYIEDDVFKGCNHLSVITIWDTDQGLEQIGAGAFLSTSSLQKIIYLGYSYDWEYVTERYNVGLRDTVRVVCLKDKDKYDITFQSTQGRLYKEGDVYYTNGDVSISEISGYECEGGFSSSHGSYNPKFRVYKVDIHGSETFYKYLGAVRYDVFKAEGRYLFRMESEYGEEFSKDFTVVIDKTAPTGTLYNVNEFNCSNDRVHFMIRNSDEFATLNGKEYKSLFPIYDEGLNTIVLYDYARNSTTYTFTIDRTKPTINATTTQSSGFGDENCTTGDVTLSDGDSGGSGIYERFLNDVAYTETPDNITQEGFYTYKVTDKAGNSTTYTFTIDRIAPTGTLTTTQSGGFIAGNYTNGNVMFTWTTASLGEAPISATLNGSVYSSGTSVASEQSHTIVLSDCAGNSTTYTFTVDKTAPTGTLATTQSGGFGTGIYTNGNVTFTWTAASPGEAPIDGATLNGNEYSSETTIKTEKVHTIILSDIVGNSTTYTFVIDKTAPTGSLAGVTNGGFTNKNVTLSWTAASSNEAPISATLNGSGYSSGASITSERSHEVVLADCAGNSTTYAFVIDKTAPTGVLTTSQSGGFRTGNFTNGNVTFGWAAATSNEAPISATLNGSGYSLGASVKSERAHEIVLTDRAGNSTSYTFTIDKTAPTGTLSGVSNGGFTNKAVAFSWADAASSEAPISATLNGAGYIAGASIDGENEYSLVLSDHAGNSTGYTFVIDKTAPTGTLTTSQSGGFRTDKYTNGNVTFTWSEAIGGSGSQRVNGRDILTAKYTRTDFNGSLAEQEQTYTRSALSAEGHYVITIYDQTGNSTSYSFVIDRTKPTLLIAGSGVSSNAVYGNGAELTYTDVGSAVTSINGTQRMVNVGANGIEISAEAQTTVLTSGSKLSQGEYTVRLTDKAGNESETTLLCIGSVYSVNYEKLTHSGFLSAGTYKVVIPYLHNISIPAVGKDGRNNRYAGRYTNSVTYVFASYENALEFMKEVEIEENVTVNAAGLYTYYQFNNHSSKTTYGDTSEAKATLEDFYKAVEKYSKVYVSEYTVPSLSSAYIGASTVVVDTAAILNLTKDDIPRIGGDYKFTSKTLTNGNYNYSTLSRVKIEQEGQTLYSGTYGSSNSFLAYVTQTQLAGGNGGFYEVTEYDSVGNEYRYTVFFDTIAPTFFATYGYYSKYTDENGDMQSELRSAELQFTSDKQIDANLKSLVITDIFDNADELFNIVVETPNGERIRVYDRSLLTFGEGQNFIAGGNYVVRIYDRTGNFFEYPFTIYGGAPRVSTYITGSGDNRTITIGFSNANNYSSIVRFDIYRYGEKLPEGEYREEADGTLINTLYIDQNTWEYKFYFGGIYKIRFCDSFSCVTETEEIVFTKGLPTYTLTGVENGGVTRRAVSLTFAQTVGYEILKDGEAFTRATATERDEQKLSFAALQAENGFYEIKLFRKTDVKTYVKVSFTIDTVPPTAEARLRNDTVAQWDSTVREPFRIAWTDSIMRVRYSRSGEYPSNYTEGTFLDVDGDYEITITDTAGNSAVFHIVLDTVANYRIDYSGNKVDGKELVYVGKSFTVTNLEWLTLNILRDGAELENARFDTEYFAEGCYDITVTDAVGNSASERIVIDKTAPTATVEQGDGYAPVSITYDASDVTSISVRKDGKKLEADINGMVSFEDWGVYTVELFDLLENKNTLNITILKRAPVVQAFTVSDKKIPSGETVNESVYFTWNDMEATGRIKVDGGVSKTYTPEMVLQDEGAYELVVTDAANNKVTIQVTIRKRFSYAVLGADGRKLVTSDCGGMKATKESFYIAEIDEATITVQKDGADFEYAFGQKITEDGLYSFVLSDNCGNVECYEILRKTTPPSVTLSDREKDTDPLAVWITGAAAVKFTKKAVTVTQATLKVESEYTFTEWGEYELTVSDELGNAATVQFKIKKTAPVLLAYTTEGTAIPDASMVNCGVVLHSEEGVVIRYSIDDGYSKIYRADTVLTDEGAYKVVGTDEAGNVVELRFDIDSKVNLSVIADGAQLKGITEKITAAKYVEISFKEAVGIECTNIDMQQAASGDSLRFDAEGIYELTLFDEAGNTAKAVIEIDFTPPACLASVENNTVTKDDVLISLVDLSDVAEYKLRRDGKAQKDYVLSENNVFDEAGVYELTLIDAIGNSVQKTFTIKRGIAYNLSVPNGFITHDDVTITVKDEATLQVLLNGEETEATYDDGKYRFAGVGMYQVTMTDTVGNVAVVIFEIDDEIYKKEFTYTLPVGISCKLTKDGKEVLVDKLITGDKLTVYEDGEYCLTLQSDEKKSEYNFVIDTKIPALLINGNEYVNGEEISNLKKDFTLTANKKQCEIEVYYNGARAEYTEGEKLSANGEYKVVIRDNVGNEVTYEFEKEFTLNTGSIVFIIMCSMLVVLVVVLIVRRRVKMRIR